MSVKFNGGLDDLLRDVKAARKKGLEELKDQLAARMDSPGPSGPGEYPGVDTGEFAGSFFVSEEGVGNNALHAEYLEFKHPSEGGRQPFSVGAADPQLQEAVAKAVVREIKRG